MNPVPAARADIFENQEAVEVMLNFCSTCVNSLSLSKIVPPSVIVFVSVVCALHGWKGFL